jgi:predicted ATPase/class 3 adenylate cyclase
MLALVYTDIVDSTLLNEQLGDAAMTAVWDRHDGASRALLQRWQGEEIDRSDGFLAIFYDADHAARFAADYHAMTRTLQPPLFARMGLHVGELQRRINSDAMLARGARRMEVFGIAKAVVSRLMGLAGGGQTLMSAAAAAKLAGTSWHTLRHGHWRLKGVAEPLEVWELGLPWAPMTPPPDNDKAHRVLLRDGHWVGLRDVPRRLPAERDTFHGRAAELNRLVDVFANGGRVAVVTGPGGVGKTRLALRHAWGWLGEFPGGVFFSDLSAARTLEDATSTIAHALDVLPGPGDEARIAKVLASRGRTLMVLDTFEHLIDAGLDLLAHWLDHAPGVHVVITSTEAFHLPGSWIVPVSSLDVDTATDLFVRRAHAGGAGDAELADGQAIGELVALLDGLPLAIELAAARAGSLGLVGLRQQMHSRLESLSTRGGRPRRQTTMRAAIEWSWNLLAEEERLRLARLSVFAGPFDTAAAAAVGGLDGAADNLLAAMTAKSLLVRGQDGRHSFLTMIREFAAESLGRLADEQAAALDRHADHWAALPEDGATRDGCHDLVEYEAACRHAVATRRVGTAVACLRRAWACLRLVGPFGRGVELADDLLAVATETSARAWGLCVRSAAQFSLRCLDEALHDATAGLALPVGADDTLAARLHCAAAEVHSLRGAIAPALDHFEAARTHAQVARDTATLCQALNGLGLLSVDRGRDDEARHLYGEACRVARTAGHLDWEGGALGNLGGLEFGCGELDRARDTFEAALRLARSGNARRWEGNARCNLGLIYLEQRRPADAARELAAALDIARQLGHQALAYTASCNLGLVQEALGNLPAACTLHEEAERAAGDAGDTRSQVQFAACLGSALARAGRIHDASTHLGRALQAARTLGDPLGQALVCISLAETCVLAGDLGEARRLLDEATASRLPSWGEASEFGRRYAVVCAQLERAHRA